MIDKKKLLQRLNKGTKLKEYPLLNLYILIAVFFQVIGELTTISIFQMIKPLPPLLMVIYIHNKNTTRSHLVPRLVQICLAVLLLADVFKIFDEPSSRLISTILMSVASFIYCVALRFGDMIRYLKRQQVWLRRFGYLMVFLIVFIRLYVNWDGLQNKLVNTISEIGLGLQLCICLWRYEITLKSSFLFSLIGTALVILSDWLYLLAKDNSLIVAGIQLFYYCGHYFLMHGSLHQSNLQFEIDKMQDNYRRTY